MNTIERTQIVGCCTITNHATDWGEVTLTLPGSPVAEVEVTRPDQDAVTTFRGNDAVVYVASTTDPDGAYSVHFENGYLAHCTCAACVKSPNRWEREGCIHARAAEAVMAARAETGKLRLRLIKDLLKECGWTAPKWGYELRIAKRTTGGDAWETAGLMHARHAPRYKFERAA